MKIHTGDKPYECKVCEKAFRAKTHLDDHIRTHTGDYRHKCSICGKGYNRKLFLRRHLRIHTDDEPYKGTGCEKALNGEIPKPTEDVEEKNNSGPKIEVQEVNIKSKEGKSLEEIAENNTESDVQSITLKDIAENNTESDVQSIISDYIPGSIKQDDIKKDVNEETNYPVEYINGRRIVFLRTNLQGPELLEYFDMLGDQSSDEFREAAKVRNCIRNNHWFTD